MECTYPVTENGKHVGKASVRRDGLYYQFSCRCQLADSSMCRLFVHCCNSSVNLGILIPNDDSFILHTKVPVKRIGEGEMSFTLLRKGEIQPKTFVPISPEEPFAYISRLKESFLTLRSGQPGILIEKMQEH